MDDEKGMVPRLDSLRERVREARSSILDVVVRIDDIELQQIPQAKVEWQLKIGCWEQALLEAELAGRRARRRLTLMRARANRGERIDVAAIEAQIDEEHVAWAEEVEQARKAYASAMARLASSKRLSPAESKEVKRVYRVLMTRLHPDVCRVEGEDVDGLFLAAKLAYENGNLPMLRSLEAATSSFGEDDGLDDVTDVGELERRLEAATAEEAAARRRLAELEQCEDLRRLALLGDREWVEERAARLRDAADRWEQVVRECRAKELELRGERNGR